MKKLILLLCLAGCIPSPVVEVPTVIEIPSVPHPTIEEVKPTTHIQWIAERGSDDIERTMISPYEFVLKKDELVVTVKLENSVLTLECSNGAKIDSYCLATPSRFTFVCDGEAIYPLVVKVSCKIESIQGE